MEFTIQRSLYAPLPTYHWRFLGWKLTVKFMTDGFEPPVTDQRSLFLMYQKCLPTVGRTNRMPAQVLLSSRATVCLVLVCLQLLVLLSIFVHVYYISFLRAVYYSILNVEPAVFLQILVHFLPDYLVVTFMVILWEYQIHRYASYFSTNVHWSSNAGRDRYAKSHIFDHTVKCMIATLLSVWESVTSAVCYWCQELCSAADCNRCASDLFCSVFEENVLFDIQRTMHHDIFL